MSSPHGWGTNGVLVVGEKGQIKAQGQRLAHPSAVTVSADIDLTKVPFATIVKAKLIVSFTVAASGTTVREIDCAAGISISGFADEVSAYVVDESPTVTGDTYPIHVVMSRYPRPGGVSPVRTGFNGAIGATGSQIVAVPRGASGVMVLGSQFAGLTIAQLANNPVDGPVAVASSDVTIGQTLPLVQGARFVNVANPSGSPTSVSVIFQIDG